MCNQGTESQFEETTIDRVRALGYRYQYGGKIERDWRDVVMTDWLRAFLKKKYPKLPADALEEASDEKTQLVSLAASPPATLAMQILDRRGDRQAS